MTSQDKELAQLRKHINHVGASNVKAAMDYAARWQNWADRLYALTQCIPGPCNPHFLDELGERRPVALDVVDVDTADMARQLATVRMQADVMAAALDRAARAVVSNTTTALGCLVDREEAA